MEPDRRSAVSSFYNRPRTSGDALNVEYPASYPQPDRARRDSSSTFFGTGNVAAPPAGAGYANRPASYFDQGPRTQPVKGLQEEDDLGADQGWDVYADFNNAGPRYSQAFGQTTAAGYHPIPTPSPATPTLADTKYEGDYAHPAQLEGGINTGDGNVELVTVPGLGPEWSKRELQEMTKKGKKKERKESALQKWREWNRDQRGCCGMQFMTRRTLVFVMFGVCVAVGIILAFTIPRVPSLQLNSDTPLVNATGSFAKSIPTRFSRSPANFTFASAADMQVDTGSNFLPLRMTSMKAEVFDTDTNFKVASGEIGHQTYKAKTFTHVSLPLNFTYVAVNDSDTTWTTWYDACRNKAFYTDGKRPGLKFKLVLTMDIFGLIGKKVSATSVTNAPCPVELSQSAP
ncbi:hypothetical protein PUNSTDRAFT_81659 [Punctularia strigosozonata HHB-11173 SS5]|uniref:uncharacterized protein n=1 Tax=Punctularia strigosozonata (strain HHB-11173) TaxID=741275 RepID=UPI00044174D0|nr:uncharacterized protein PUNSTDRAFT_81659 [Punctularia strigosozonata HHB-11173 SS5]EIN12431.1 hypothetical protein PUNSTDRAFT_81659 [Punctularia strigosozonata HHB-11173 SS5]